MLGQLHPQRAGDLAKPQPLGVRHHIHAYFGGAHANADHAHVHTHAGVVGVHVWALSYGVGARMLFCTFGHGIAYAFRFVRYMWL